jgi:23S rRNA pseudouridine2457 synthase
MQGFLMLDVSPAFVAKLAAMPRPFSSNRSSNLRRSTVVRQPASRPEVTRLLCFHKPYGVLSQFTPEGKWQGLKDWIDVPGVYVAGRLDADSEGLLLLTNDGQLQARIADRATRWRRPTGCRSKACRTSRAAAPARGRGVERRQDPARQGPPDRPQPCMWPRNPPIRVRQNIPDCWIELVIREGRNRQVRRMTAAVGHPTLRLVRMAVGPYSIEGLEPGQWLDVLPLSGS